MPTYMKLTREGENLPLDWSMFDLALIHYATCLERINLDGWSKDTIFDNVSYWPTEEYTFRSDMTLWFVSNKIEREVTEEDSGVDYDTMDIMGRSCPKGCTFEDRIYYHRTDGLEEYEKNLLSSIEACPNLTLSGKMEIKSGDKFVSWRSW